MTLEQLQIIQSKLEDWRTSRDLTIEMQKDNFKVNYTKELLEYFEAERDNDDEGMIDAICDLIVIAINAGYTVSSDDLLRASETKDRDLSSNEISWELCGCLSGTSELHRLIKALVTKGYNPYLCLLETVEELNSRQGKWDELQGKWVKDIGAYNMHEATQIADSHFKKLNINSPIAMTTNDTHYLFTCEDNPVLRVSKWIKADYSKCKL